MNLKLLVVTTMGLMLSASVQAAGDAQAGQTLASTKCVACHGLDGNSVNPQWPSIAGQQESYIVKHVKAIRDGSRAAPLMMPMVTDMTDKQIEDVAAFYTTQKAKGQEAAQNAVALGQKIYRAGSQDQKIPACIACHGPDGRGNPGNFPAIRSQHATYLVAQLQAYKAGTRTSDQNEMMRTIATRLSDTEINAVAQYMQGLR